MDLSDIEERIDDLDDRPDDDLEIVIEDTVVTSGWEPDDGEERPEVGTTKTRYFVNDSGEWVSEELSGADE